MPGLSASSLSLLNCAGTTHTTHTHTEKKGSRLVAIAMRQLSAFSSRSVAPQRGSPRGNKFYHRLRAVARGMPRSASLGDFLLLVTPKPLVPNYLNSVASLPYRTVSHFEMPPIPWGPWAQQQQSKLKKTKFLRPSFREMIFFSPCIVSG